MSSVPPPTVLLIDSHKEDRQYWKHRLNISSPHFVVLEADTGASGLAICRSQRVDCVSVELDLSDMSGFEVLINLVPRARYPETAVIILSRLSLPALAELAKSNGALAYLIKSHISGDVLDRSIRKAIATVSPEGTRLAKSATELFTKKRSLHHG
jgi:DNA-binding NarL/FixJ family response regulator